MSSPLRGPKSRSGDCPARDLALGGGAVIDDDGTDQFGGVGLYRRDQRGILPVVDQRDQVGVADHIAQLGFDVPVVDVHGPGAQLVRRDQRLDRLDRVARVQPDVVVRPYPDAGQVMREPVGALVKLAVGHLPVTAGQRHPAGNDVGGMLEQIGDIECHVTKLEPVTVWRQYSAD
jgi:hypothetical protein